MLEGMDDPLYIPDDQILVDDKKNQNDAPKLRPTSNRPFVTDKDVLTVRIWIMPAARIKSAELVTFTNVDTFDVYYVKPGKSSKEVLYEEVCVCFNRNFIA